MTVTPSRARGVIDAETGALVAVTGQGISWLRPDNAGVEVTPDFVWGPVAAGGGAVAMAGSEYLRWHGPDGAVRTLPAPTEDSYRLAVAGPAVATVSEQGQLTCWRSVDSVPHTGTVNFEPDGLAFDPTGSRVAVWGWDAGGVAVMAVFGWDTSSLTVTTPVEAWPAPECGVAFLAGGAIGVGGSDSVIVLSATGEKLARSSLPGLERMAGSASGVAWIRSAGADLLVAGVGVFPGPGGAMALRLAAEAPDPATDPFPEFAAMPGGELLLVAGIGPHEIAVHRLTGDGWSEPTTVRLPARG